MSEPQKRWTVPMLGEARAAGRKLVMLTAYDASFARVLDDNGIDLILVGDSLGMVVQGFDSTLPVRVDDIVYHTAAVARVRHALLKIADLPFGSDGTPREAHAAAVRFIQAGREHGQAGRRGPQAGDDPLSRRARNSRCAHLGLTPQSVHRFGGFKVQGREDAAAALREDALAVAEAGAALLVLECVPAALARRSPPPARSRPSASAPAPVAMARCWCCTTCSAWTPAIASRNSSRISWPRAAPSPAAIRAYADAVRDGRFPAAEHAYA
jgi:3-methyl-2-oxobutanoate hydroxymethyltransferase